jgi:hypothetical protein
MLRSSSELRVESGEAKKHAGTRQVQWQNGRATRGVTMIREGDFIEIPLPDGRTAIGWILLVSKEFKDTIGFIVFVIKGHVRSEDIKVGATIRALGPFYTQVANLDHYGCKIVDYAPIPDSRRNLTKRDVGGGVYVGDEYIGSAEELGEYNLRPMLFMGMPLIQKEIEEGFSTSL